MCNRWESVWDEWGSAEGGARLEIGGEGNGAWEGNKEYGLV